MGATFPGEDERESYRAPATLVLVSSAIAALAAAALVLSGVEVLAARARTAARHRVENTVHDVRERVLDHAHGPRGLEAAAAALHETRLAERLRREGFVSATVVDERARPVGRALHIVPVPTVDRASLEELSIPLDEGTRWGGSALRFEVVAPERSIEDARLDALARCAAAGGLALALVLGATLVATRLVHRERARAGTVRARSRLARLGVLAGGLARELELAFQGVHEALSQLKERLPEELPHLDDEPTAGDLCDAAGTNVARAEGIVRDFLSYARPEPSPPRVCDVAALVRDWARVLDPELGAHGVGLLVEGAGRSACAVVDPAGLKQIFWSVVRNARDAAPRGTVVRVSLTRDSERVRIRVSDTGPGIVSPRREEVFEPLVSTKPWGTGLGLAVSRRLAEAMGAKLCLVGGPPGAVFELALRPAPITVAVDFAITEPPPIGGLQEAA